MRRESGSRTVDVLHVPRTSNRDRRWQALQVLVISICSTCVVLFFGDSAQRTSTELASSELWDVVIPRIDLSQTISYGDRCMRPRRYRAWREHESLSCRVVMGPATELWQGVEGDEMRHRRSSLVQHSD